jgi:chromate transporter
MDGTGGPGELAANKVSFYEALRFWFKLGFISFGGPAGQIAVMHTELVERRRWIDEPHFLHALNYCMLLPGPEAQQLATYMGWLMHGTLGGIVAGALFVLPSLGILIGLGWIYVTYQDLPLTTAVLATIKPVVVAIVVQAVLRLGQRVLSGKLAIFLAAAGLAGMMVNIPFPILVIVAASLGWALGAEPNASGHGATGGYASVQPVVIAQAPPAWGWLVRRLLTWGGLWAAPFGMLAGLPMEWQIYRQMAWLFTKAALVTFGGAYAVLPYVSHQVAEVHQWASEQQVIDGLALGETTPGPLIMIVAFLGFVGSWQQLQQGFWGAAGGATVATYFTFLPSFMFILIGAPYVERMRGDARLGKALWGISALVVGVILHLALVLGRATFWPKGSDWWQVDWWLLALGVAALIAMRRYRVDVAKLVAACALLGAAGYWFGWLPR